MPMQSSPDHTPIFEGDASPGLVVTHPIQPTVEEVVVPMQSLVNPTLLFEGDASLVTLSLLRVMHPLFSCIYSTNG
jgi:hypothetical protein